MNKIREFNPKQSTKTKTTPKKISQKIRIKFFEFTGHWSLPGGRPIGGGLWEREKVEEERGRAEKEEREWEEKIDIW